MDYIDPSRQQDWQEIAGRIRSSPGPEVEKLAQAFGWITGCIIEHAQKEAEVARALRDGEALVREQTKAEMIRHARSIFQHCHILATGRKAWNDQDTPRS
jgi:hypothetical protein